MDNSIKINNNVGLFISNNLEFEFDLSRNIRYKINVAKLDNATVKNLFQLNAVITYIQIISQMSYGMDIDKFRQYLTDNDLWRFLDQVEV